MNKNVRLYRVKKHYAMENQIPVFFEASTLIETTKALYLYGKGQLGDRLALVDQWFPKSVLGVRDIVRTVINIPDDHPMLPQSPKNRRRSGPEKYMKLLDNDQLELTRIYYSHDRDFVKKISSAFYNPYKKIWLIPFNDDNLQKLRSRGFILDETSEKLLKPPPLSLAPIPKKIKGLDATLYDFQHEGVAAMDYWRGRALLADEMGLGKTIQSLAWLQLRPEIRPAIIVVPSNVKLKWEREALRFMTDVTTQVLSGKVPNCALSADLVIINYDILQYWIKELIAYEAAALIFDECHMFKNNKAARTKAVKKLSKNKRHIICLSGTPILSRPIEIFNAVNLIAPGLFPNYFKFGMRYCNGKNNGFAWDFSGASNMKELHVILTGSVMIRRKKFDVLDELPDKQFSFVPQTINNRPLYKSAERDFIDYISMTKGRWDARKAKSAEHLVRIEALKQIAVEGKLNETIDWITNFLRSGEKLVVFTMHKATLKKIMTEFKDVAVSMAGGMTDKQKQKVEDDFQENEEIKLFVGNIKAAGSSITLTAASNVAFVELPWTPGELVQAADRCHRITQVNAVTVYYLVAENTIEEKIAVLLDDKQKVLDAILDGKNTTQSSMIMDLFDAYGA